MTCLVIKYINGELSDSEKQVLFTQMSDNEELRQELVDYIHLNACLKMQIVHGKSTDTEEKLQNLLKRLKI